ncbi:hypothetical protein VCHC17A1_4035A, partial [Vibrio cholerae HC-17A1]
MQIFRGVSKNDT